MTTAAWVVGNGGLVEYGGHPDGREAAGGPAFISVVTSEVRQKQVLRSLTLASG
jgi:hypothetical protein